MGETRRERGNKWETEERSYAMASTFAIGYDHRGNTLHLTLSGDFDGASADVLLDVIEGYGKDMEKIFIHTDALRSIHPFGQVLFQNKFNLLKNRSAALVFDGKNRKKILPEKDGVSWVTI
jgi:hypothetical protein